MARKYTHSQSFLEKQRLKQEAKNAKKLNKLDLRKNETYNKIKQSVNELTSGLVFDPHKKKEFQEYVENNKAFKQHVKMIKQTGAETLEDFAIGFVSSLGLTGAQADAIASNVNEQYISEVKSQTMSLMTIKDIRNKQLRDELSNDIKNVMLQYSNSIDEFKIFELTSADILSLSGKWIAIQAIIEKFDTWDEMFDS